MAAERRRKGSYDYLKNEEKIRALILEELLETEKVFLQKMDFTITRMKRDLDRCSDLIEYEIDEGHVRGLFGNIDEIHRIHLMFYSELRRALPEGREREPKNSVGQCFISMKEDFQIYDQYISNHSRSQIMMSDLMKMSSMKRVIQMWTKDCPTPKEDFKGKSVLEVYLREPLLRIGRYSVILKELATFTSFNHPDLEDIIVAHQVIQSLLMSFDSVKKMDLLTAAFDSCDKNRLMWEKSGLSDKDGFLTKRGGNVKSWKIRWFTLKGFEMKYYDEPSNERPLFTLDLKQCKTVTEENSVGKKYCFGIHMPDRTYIIYCISETERMAWMNAIAWRIFNHYPSHMRAGQCMSTSSIPSTEISPVLSMVQKHSVANCSNGTGSA